MDLRNRSIDRFACSRPVIECAQCGEPIDLSERLEYLDSHRARHLRHCDTCGVSFETTVRIAAA